jgi:uncharacterized protein (TIGR01777 family)
MQAIPASNTLTSNIYEKLSFYSCSAEELFDWHARPGALERLLPPWENTTVIRSSGTIEPGAEIQLRMHLGPVPFMFTARHTDLVAGKMFRDTQARGPFSSWSHTHIFEDRHNGAELLDRIEYRLPLHGLMPQILHRFVIKNLERMFSFRNTVLKDDLSLHARCSIRPLTILVSGASGSLGRDLLPLLSTGGHRVYTLVRRIPVKHKNEIFWNPDAGILDPEDLPAIDAVIHLAGEYIGLRRWTLESKRRVLESRIKGTGLLARTIAQLASPPAVFLCASAVGYYGDCQDRTVDEDSPAGSDFISEVCLRWERAAKSVTSAGIRSVFLRFGVGLSPRSGALRRILSSSPLGFHSRFGHGGQYISWISHDDMISAILHALTCTSLEGPVNIAAPTPVTNSELMATLSKVTGRPRLFPVPARPLQFVYGQMAREILLSGCRVSSAKLIDSGYRFRHPDLETALRFMLGRAN